MKKHEYLEEKDYYEDRSVKRGQKDKTCEHCGRVIPKGQPHTMHHFYPDFYAYATHTMDPLYGDKLKPGEVSCSDQFIKSLN